MARTILRAGRIAAGAIIAFVILGIILYSARVFTGAAVSPPPGAEEPEVVETPVAEPVVYTAEQIELLAVVEEKPGTYDALMALKKLAMQHIAAGQDALAVDALVQLVGTFVDSPHLPGNVHDIVRTAAKEDKAAAVSQLCAALAVQAGQTPGAAVWLGMGEVLAAVYQGDDAAVDAATQRLVAAHGTDGRCVEAFGQVAYAFRQLKKYERSRQYYQYVVDNWPHGPRAVFSQRGLIWVNETLGDEAAAFAALNTLLTDYAADPHLVECIRPLADSYEGKKDYNTAIRIHQYVSDTQPENGMAVWSQFKVFQIALTKLHDDVLADRAYQQIWERYRGHDRIAQVVCEAAWEYRKLKRQAEALEMYRAAQAAQPDNDRAIIAQRGIVCCLLALEDHPAAIAEAQKLLTAFTNDKQLPLTAIEVGDALGAAWLYPEALTMYQHVVDHHPADSRAITAQRKVVTTHIKMDDEPAAQQALDALMLGFADDPRLSTELYAVGECYRTRKDYPSARALYDYVITEYPQGKDAMWSSQRLVVMHMDETEDPNHPTADISPPLAQTINALITLYEKQPELPHAIFLIGEEYYALGEKARKNLAGQWQANFGKSITLWSKVVDELPTGPYTLMAHDYRGGAYRAIGDYAAALNDYECLARDYPDYDRHWHACFAVIRCYEDMAAAGLLTNTEAAAGIIPAAERLIQAYPDWALERLKMDRKIKKWQFMVSLEEGGQ